MLKKSSLFWALGIIAILFFVIAMFGSSDFQNCVSQCAYTAQEQQSTSSRFFSFINTALDWTRLPCVELFITHAHEEILAIFTVLLAFFTLALWASTAEIARDAKATGERTIRTMEDTAKRQLRAYVSAFPSSISSFDKDHFAIASFPIKNSGQTPAYNVTHRARVIVAPYPLEEGYTFPQIVGDPRPSLALFPNNPITGGKGADGPFTEGQIASIIDGSMRVYIYGEIRYETIFHKNGWSTFGASVKADRSTLEKLTSNYLGTDLSITYEMTKTWNDADRN
jgi:hypothetical protein